MDGVSSYYEHSIPTVSVTVLQFKIDSSSLLQSYVLMLVNTT